MSARKIVQLCYVDEPNGYLACVADDGTAWKLWSGKWQRLPNLPPSADEYLRALQEQEHAGNSNVAK